VYNVFNYLPQCLHSLCSQTSSDYEIIAVNDGSTDESDALLWRYARAFPQVRVVEKMNGGLSSARNAGIAAARGDIIAFVDADDTVAPELVATLDAAFTRTGAQVVTYGADVIPAYASYPWIEENLSPREVTYHGFEPALLFEENSHPFAWRTACTREFLLASGVRFDETLPFGEDQAFHFAIYPRAAVTALIPNKLYHYRLARPGSLMATRKTNLTQRIHDHIRIVEHICKDWHTAGFSQAWGLDLALWTCDFVGLDIMRVAEPARTPLMNYLAGVWQTYFAQEQLEDLMANQLVGPFATAILANRSLAQGLARKQLFYAHTLATEGLAPFVQNPANRLLEAAPVRRARYAVEAAAPGEGALHAREREEALWAATDAQATLDALDALVAAEKPLG
jgi:hypothetical protein